MKKKLVAVIVDGKKKLVPEREAWIYKDKKLYKELLRSIADSKAGRTKICKVDFSKYAKED